MEAIVDLFRELKTDFDAGLRRDPGLVCKVGFYGGCPVLKLRKRAWTNDNMRTVPNVTGIFFSIWVDEQAVQNGHIKYNIHALKLRKLTGYKLTSRAFAREFRERFKSEHPAWPNVSVDFGPQTLMQGWIECRQRKVKGDLRNLMDRFGNVSLIIDELLQARRR